MSYIISTILTFFLFFVTGCGSSSPLSDHKVPQLLDFRQRLVLKSSDGYRFRAYDDNPPVSFKLIDPPSDVNLSDGVLHIGEGIGKEYHLLVRISDSVGNFVDKNITVFRVLEDDPNIPLEFKLIKKDERYTWEQSIKNCQNLGDGWSVPTIWQFKNNNEKIYDMVKDIDSDLNSSNGNGGFVSAIWAIEPADELNAGLRAKAWSYNPSVLGEIEDPIAGEDRERYFNLCVKSAN